MSSADKSAWCYKTLGLPEGSGEQDIQNAYRKLVRAYHPDINKRPDAPFRFRKVVEAYGALMEEIKLREVFSGERIVERVERDESLRSMSLEELEHRLVHSVSPQVRATAAAAAGLKGGNGAKSLLTGALNDSDECVRNVSMIMLTRIGGAGDLPNLLGSVVRNGNTDSLKTAGRLVWKQLKKLPGGLAGSFFQGPAPAGKPAVSKG
jgi:hypothetical protein